MKIVNLSGKKTGSIRPDAIRFAGSGLDPRSILKSASSHLAALRKEPAYASQSLPESMTEPGAGPMEEDTPAPAPAPTSVRDQLAAATAARLAREAAQLCVCLG